MDILTLNCGSSSLKYQLYRWDDRDVLASGIVERVTVGGSFINHYSKKSGKKMKREHDCPHHRDAIELIVADAAGSRGRRHLRPLRDQGRRPPGGARRGPVRQVGDHRRRRPRGLPRPLRPRAPAQPAEHHRHRGGAGGAARRAALRGHGHRVAPDHAQDRVPLRPALPVVRELPGAPLRLPRDLVPLRVQARLGAPGQGPLRHQPHLLPHRQRLQRQRGEERRLGGHLDGLHAAGGARHGHPRRRPRPGHRLLRDAQGRAAARGHGQHPQPQERRAGHHGQVHRPARHRERRLRGRRALPARHRHRRLPAEEVPRRLLRGPGPGGRHRVHRGRRRARAHHPGEVPRGPGGHGHRPGPAGRTSSP